MVNAAALLLQLQLLWLAALSRRVVAFSPQASVPPLLSISDRTNAQVRFESRMSSESTATTTSALHSMVSSWSDLEKQIGVSYLNPVPVPVSIDSVLQPEKPSFSTDQPTLFRERHGWCPYSERVWLTLELLDIPYDTIRIDNTGGPRPSYYSGATTPQMEWPNGKTQGESMDLVYQLDEDYSSYDFQSANSQVRETISKFRSVFPSGARPSSRAAFLFQYSGEPLWKSTFEETLKKTDELLAETKGPFFVGDSLTAADIAWCPFLERYRYQLPCLHEDLNPYDSKLYPHLTAWYNAMDQIPAYACRVKGNASSWRKVLFMAGFGNGGMVPIEIKGNKDNLIQRDKENMSQMNEASDLEIWQAYASTRPYVADTPQAQAAQIICSNRQVILKDTLKRGGDTSTASSSEEELDETMRELVEVLLGNADETSLTNDSRRAVGALVAFLNERMCVPRDMGATPAAVLEHLEWKLQTYN
eukprot:CAMPEP_0198144192 /NCGR_PEP_ID=MMETSP1443-20131203/13990_1 /TAXON_ID=186043 /ORGANISM="Entomoneis sp., Strain CCMP2396" /LENGTH=474 /DNA_ID=CAMNT_0043807545 /DNA_START=59 /DNA_END=1483 /DNA_ORIENTATION=+